MANPASLALGEEAVEVTTLQTQGKHNTDVIQEDGISTKKQKLGPATAIIIRLDEAIRGKKLGYLYHFSTRPYLAPLNKGCTLSLGHKIFFSKYYDTHAEQALKLLEWGNEDTSEGDSSSAVPFTLNVAPTLPAKLECHGAYLANTLEQSELPNVGDSTFEQPHNETAQATPNIQQQYYVDHQSADMPLGNPNPFQYPTASEESSQFSMRGSQVIDNATNTRSYGLNRIVDLSTTSVSSVEWYNNVRDSALHMNPAMSINLSGFGLTAGTRRIAKTKEVFSRFDTTGVMRVSSLVQRQLPTLTTAGDLEAQSLGPPILEADAMAPEQEI